MIPGDEHDSKEKYNAAIDDELQQFRESVESGESVRIGSVIEQITNKMDQIPPDRALDYLSILDTISTLPNVIPGPTFEQAKEKLQQLAKEQESQEVEPEPDEDLELRKKLAERVANIKEKIDKLDVDKVRNEGRQIYIDIANLKREVKEQLNIINLTLSQRNILKALNGGQDDEERLRENKEFFIEVISTAETLARDFLDEKVIGVYKNLLDELDNRLESTIDNIQNYNPASHKDDERLREIKLEIEKYKDDLDADESDESNLVAAEKFSNLLKTIEAIETKFDSRVEAINQEKLNEKVEAQKKQEANSRGDSTSSFERLEAELDPDPENHTKNEDDRLRVIFNNIQLAENYISSVGDRLEEDVKAKLQEITTLAENLLNEIRENRLNNLIRAIEEGSSGIKEFEELKRELEEDIPDQSMASEKLNKLENLWEAVMGYDIAPIVDDSGKEIYPTDDIRSKFKNLLLKTRLSELVQERIIKISSISTTYEKSEDGVKRRSVENFFAHIKLPARNDKEKIKEFFESRKKETGIEVPPDEELTNFETYLQVVHIYLLEQATFVTWNKFYDKDKTTPHTSNWKESPGHGPLNKMDLLSIQLSRETREQYFVKNFGAVWDNFETIFTNEDEKDAAKKFKERQKALYAEISAWHNRAVVFKKHQDKTGPNGSLEAWKELKEEKETGDLSEFFNRAEMTESELRFSRAIEFCMSVWSVMSLKEYERKKLIDANRISPDVLDIIDNPDFQNLVPNYRSTSIKENFVELIKKMIEKSQELFGLTKMQAELAYHIGESFRIGSGLEIQLDARYKTDEEGNFTGGVSVEAQEGAPKGMNIGLYVHSANSNPARPDFNPVFADYIVHGYPPQARALQFTHDIEELNEFGDKRASIVEIMAVEGGVETIDWESASKDPDKIVHDAATQIIGTFWPMSKVAESVKPENSFFVDVSNIPITALQQIDRPEELDQLRHLFGYSGSIVRGITKFSKKLIPWAGGLEDYEDYSFASTSVPFDQARRDRINNMNKNFRDYWINAFKADITSHPMDFVRITKFLFTRSDRPDGYVNSKIKEIIERAKTEMETISSKINADNLDSIRDEVQIEMRGQTSDKIDKEIQERIQKLITNEQSKWVIDVYVPLITAYTMFDMLMRATFFLAQPDTRQVSKLHNEDDPSTLAKIYDEMNYHNFRDFEMVTRGNQRLVNTPQLMYIINQAILLRDLNSVSRDEMKEAGYRLYSDNEADSIFSREDLLTLAKEFKLGEGFEWQQVRDGSGDTIYQLQRKEGSEKTLQMLCNRLFLLMHLFDKPKLGSIGDK